ncbi:MAG: hypothetical protein DME23_14720 [Verrucomicrobia bacterium]|nr:MAG: hypothetical protein DME23_14720 [Verrucomicrobiota bacterium]
MLPVQARILALVRIRVSVPVRVRVSVLVPLLMPVVPRLRASARLRVLMAAPEQVLVARQRLSSLPRLKHRERQPGKAAQECSRVPADFFAAPGARIEKA